VTATPLPDRPCARTRFLPLAVADEALRQHLAAMPSPMAPPEVVARWNDECRRLRLQVRAEVLHYAHRLCTGCFGFGTLPPLFGSNIPCTLCAGDGWRSP